MLIAVLAWWFAGSGMAAPVSFYIDPTVPVYDLTGSYELTQQVIAPDGSAVDAVLGFAIALDGTGRVRGAGSTTVQLGNDSYPASYSVSGRVSGGGKVTRVHIVARWTGREPVAGASQPLSVFVQYNLTVVPGGLAGTARGNVRFASFGRGRIHSGVPFLPLPAGADGSWTVQLDLGSGDSAGDGGVILLPNGRDLRGIVAWGLGTELSVERMKLLGTNADKGNTLNVRIARHTEALQSLSGRILGQTVSRASAISAYAGMQACIECHGPVNQTLQSTVHAQVGVQCEDCHGPAANHAANYYDPTTKPVVDLTGQYCGRCHSGPQHPIYEEWSASAHATVVLDLNPTNRISSCGRCHSGSVRESLLDGAPLPFGAANVPIGCPVCHEPHELTGNPFQLRNPMVSTNDYSMSTDDDFASKYDPSVNLCAQCHNDRGASWMDSSGPPHFSPQYNILLGTVGELDSGLPHFQPATHALAITNQCVGCHMQTSPYASDAQPAVSGHHFKVESFATCTACHPLPEQLAQFVMGAVSNQIQQVKFELDFWAANKAPAALYDKYGTRAWEYTRPGELSTGGPGPTADEQGQIPVMIQKARFNMYLVLHDGSFGVHNGPYSVTLLDTAQAWIESELDQ